MAQRIYYKGGRHDAVLELDNPLALSCRISRSRICATCRFSNLDPHSWTFEDRENGRVVFSMGECRLNAPDEKGFPKVKGDCWCGQHRPQDCRNDYGVI